MPAVTRPGGEFPAGAAAHSMPRPSSPVMAGLVPAIHVEQTPKTFRKRPEHRSDVDPRDKPHRR